MYALQLKVNYPRLRSPESQHIERGEDLGIGRADSVSPYPAALIVIHNINKMICLVQTRLCTGRHGVAGILLEQRTTDTSSVSLLVYVYTWGQVKHPEKHTRTGCI